MSKQKNPRKKALTRTVWLAPSLGVSIAAVLLILFSIADPSHGQTISDTQVTLSCNAGHSCTLDPAATPPTSWTVFDYNPSGQAIRPRLSADSMPATTSGNTTSFPFKLSTFTALLTTTDASLTGDLSMKTLSVSVGVTGGSGMFEDQHNGGCTPDE